MLCVIVEPKKQLTTSILTMVREISPKYQSTQTLFLQTILCAISKIPQSKLCNPCQNQCLEPCETKAAIENTARSQLCVHMNVYTREKNTNKRPENRLHYRDPKLF